MADTERALADAIVGLLEQRTDGATICPSEAARRVDPESWRDLMPDARAVAARLVDDGAALGHLDRQRGDQADNQIQHADRVRKSPISGDGPAVIVARP